GRLFVSGVMLQFVNFKVISYGLTVMASFILPHYRGLLPIAGFVVLLAVFSLVSTACWALFGAAFDRLFRQHGRALNAAMALLLIYCAVTMLRDV
ncbi:MAG: lysine transporter LysE, partial [Fretibacterium sp.]|nr:lysine transporter LysE [Fretibacterium sp.]